MAKFRSWNEKCFIYFEDGKYYFIAKSIEPELKEIASFKDFNWKNAEQFINLHDENKRDLYCGDFVEIAIDVCADGYFVTRTYKAEIKKDKFGFYFYINKYLQYYFNECITDEESQLKYIGNIHEGEN